MWWQSALGHNSQWSWIKSPKEHFFSWLWNQISTSLLSSHFPPLPQPNPSSVHTFPLFASPFSCCSLLCLCCHHLPLHSSFTSTFTLCLCCTCSTCSFWGNAFPDRRKGGPISWDLLSWAAASKWPQNDRQSPVTVPRVFPGHCRAVTDINVGKG